MSKTDPGLQATDVGGPGYETADAPEGALPANADRPDAFAGRPAQTYSAEEVANLVAQAEATASLATALGLARAANRLYMSNKARAANELARDVVTELAAYSDLVSSTKSEPTQ